MYTSNLTPSIRRQLNRNATTILLGGIFMFFSFSFFIGLCNSPENINGQYSNKLVKEAYEIHEGHNPVSRNYEKFNTRQNSNDKKSADLAILILTSPTGFLRRSAIRNSWLSYTFANVSAYFVIGSSGLNASVAKEVQTENAIHKDLLLLSNVKDSYSKLTGKLLESFKWINENLEFKYVLKCDDDTFVRLDEILTELKSKPYDRLYWGFFDGRANVKTSGKWVERNWILCDKYGPHARGGGYILSSDLVSYIVTNAHLLQIFNSEDISVGTWLGPLNIHREHDPRFDTEYISRGCNNKYLVTHKQSPEEMKNKWLSLKTKGVLCDHEHQDRPSYIYNWKVLPSQCCVRNNSNIP